jgi:hypothetical protein
MVDDKLVTSRVTDDIPAWVGETLPVVDRVEVTTASANRDGDQEDWY